LLRIELLVTLLGGAQALLFLAAERAEFTLTLLQALAILGAGLVAPRRILGFPVSRARLRLLAGLLVPPLLPAFAPRVLT